MYPRERKRCLKVLHSRGGDPGQGKIQGVKAGQWFKVSQAGIRDWEPNKFKIGQRTESSQVAWFNGRPSRVTSCGWLESSWHSQ